MATRQTYKLENFELIYEVLSSEFVLVSVVEGSNFGGLTVMTLQIKFKVGDFVSICAMGWAGLYDCTL